MGKRLLHSIRVVLSLLVVTVAGCNWVFNFDYQTACTPGAAEACYSGPEGTAGVGLCRKGTHQCKEDGIGFGDCMGEVLPSKEDCTTQEDESCDGQINEKEAGCLCKPGATAACYSGPEGTEGVGPCHGGTWTCDEFGTAYGTCLGDHTPKVEDCATPEDENCDGQVNEKEAGCLCKPGTIAACYSGPDGTEGVGMCHGGTWTCDEFGTAYGACLGEFTPKVDDCTKLNKNEVCGYIPDCGGAHVWSKRFGDAAFQDGSGIAVDSAGNVLVTGRFSASVDFGKGTLTSAGDFDIFIAKFDPEGTCLWSKRFGDANYQEGSGIAVDSAGNVLVTGSFEGSVDFGKGTLTSAGLNDIFIAKFDPEGTCLWSRNFGDAAEQYVHGIAVDGAGNVLVTGRFLGSVDFGKGTLTSAGDFDIFVAKFDPEGTCLWSKKFGDAVDQDGYGIAVDSAGNVLVTGEFEGSVDFGKGILTSAGKYDIFVAKFDPEGTCLWGKKFGDADPQEGADIAVDGAGNVLVTGYFNSSVDFGKGTLTSAGGTDIFVAKVDPDGICIWSKKFGDAAYQNGSGIAVDSAGNVLVTGSFKGSVDFGKGTLTSAGTDDIFVAKFDPEGTCLWSKKFGDAGYQAGADIAVDGAGNVLVTGYFNSSVDFGGGPLTSAGFSDVFAAKLAP